MSMKLMVRVMEECDLPRPQQAILLAMAENANDDGSRCFPSVDLIAWKAGYKPRNVVDIMRELRHAGIIAVVKEATARRPAEYQIHVERAPKKITFEEWQAINGRHSKGVRRGAVSREVQNDEGCNLTSLEVQSHVLGVQSHVQTTRENAPDPVSDPVEPVSDPVIIRAPDPEPQPKPKRATQIPDDFALTERLEAWGAKEGFPVPVMESEIPQFVDYYTAKGEARKDWEASFRTWMRNARSWNRLSHPNGSMRLVKGGKVGRDGRTDEERGWRENPGPKGWTGAELLAMSNDPYADESIFGDVIEVKGRIAR